MTCPQHLLAIIGKSASLANQHPGNHRQSYNLNGKPHWHSLANQHAGTLAIIGKLAKMCANFQTLVMPTWLKEMQDQENPPFMSVNERVFAHTYVYMCENMRPRACLMCESRCLSLMLLVRMHVHAPVHAQNVHTTFKQHKTHACSTSALRSAK